MKRNFVILTVLGALLAMAVPASSMAAKPVVVTPANHNFTISGETMPTVTGPLPGSCILNSISAHIPAAPSNENATMVTMLANAAPTASCSAGVTMGTSITTRFNAYKRGRMDLILPVTLIYASLPECALSTGTISPAVGIYTFSLGGEYGPPAYHADGYENGTWINNGAGKCPLAGKVEPVRIHTESTTIPNAPITDTTNGANTIVLSGGGL
jgi:hypothetical protein